MPPPSSSTGPGDKRRQKQLLVKQAHPLPAPVKTGGPRGTRCPLIYASGEGAQRRLPRGGPRGCRPTTALGTVNQAVCLLSLMHRCLRDNWMRRSGELMASMRQTFMYRHSMTCRRSASRCGNKAPAATELKDVFWSLDKQTPSSTLLVTERPHVGLHPKPQVKDHLPLQSLHPGRGWYRNPTPQGYQPP